MTKELGMRKSNILSKITGFFVTTAHAEGKVTTAVATTGDAVIFTDGIRMVYSKEIEFKAQPNMKFMQFASVKTELGVDPGLTISMLTYDNLKMGGALTELVNMTTQAISGSM